MFEKPQLSEFSEPKQYISAEKREFKIVRRKIRREQIMKNELRFWVYELKTKSAEWQRKRKRTEKTCNIQNKQTCYILPTNDKKLFGSLNRKIDFKFE